MKKTLTLAPGAVIEPVGDDVMVMMPGNTDILRISGPAADTLRTIVAGQPVDPSTPAVLELANHGIVSPSGMSRRSLMKAGAVGAGAGIAVLAMPSVAAASSVGGGGGGSEPIAAIWLSQSGGVILFDISEESQLAGKSGSPSGLTGLPSSFDTSSSGLVNSDSRSDSGDVSWRYTPTSGPSGPLSATFVWDGVTYQVTFQPAL